MNDFHGIRAKNASLHLESETKITKKKRGY